MSGIGEAEAGLSLLRIIGWRAMKAPVEFRAPEQRGNANAQPNEAWWYIPVAISRPYFWRQLGINEAAAYLEPIHGDSSKSSEILPGPIPLAWQYPQDVPGGQFHRESRLSYGRVIFIPCVRRDETGDGHAEITGIEALLQRDGAAKVLPADTRYRFRLKLAYGTKRWPQKKTFYIINVPPKEIANSHFSLEFRYGDSAY